MLPQDELSHECAYSLQVKQFDDIYLRGEPLTRLLMPFKLPHPPREPAILLALGTAAAAESASKR